MLYSRAGLPAGNGGCGRYTLGGMVGYLRSSDPGDRRLVGKEGLALNCVVGIGLRMAAVVCSCGICVSNEGVSGC